MNFFFLSINCNLYFKKMTKEEVEEEEEKEEEKEEEREEERERLVVSTISSPRF